MKPSLRYLPLRQIVVIEKVNISHDDLEKIIRKEIFDSPNDDLKELDFQGDGLRSVNKRIGQLTNLEFLILSYNKIESPGVPSSLNKLVSLNELHLMVNRLATIPKSICELKSLIYLDLSENFISKLPEEIGQLINLKSLFLTDNLIKKLPDSMGDMVSLEVLYITDNDLEELPESFSKLTNLTTLDIGLNKISELPTWITKLTSLQELGLDFNFDEQEARNLLPNVKIEFNE